MAKRKRSAAPNAAKKAPRKRATPSNKKPAEKSAISVNPSYDSMPDEIEDPASVFRMAMLDERRQSMAHKLAVVISEHEKRVKAALDAQKRDIAQVKMELKDAEAQLRAQKEHIEEQYGIALRAYTYNDETGLLKKSDLPEEEIAAIEGVGAN